MSKCSICGRRRGEIKCRRCGRIVCRVCYEAHGLCKECKRILLRVRNGAVRG